jgi:hypothetical protein
MTLEEFKERMNGCRERYKEVFGMTYERTHSESVKPNGWKYTFFRIKENSVSTLKDILMEEFKDEEGIKISKHVTTDKNTWVSRVSITVKWKGKINESN